MSVFVPYNDIRLCQLLVEVFDGLRVLWLTEVIVKIFQ